MKHRWHIGHCVVVVVGAVCSLAMSCSSDVDQEVSRLSSPANATDAAGTSASTPMPPTMQPIAMAMHAPPGADCLLHLQGDDDPSRGTRVFADDSGTVRFYLSSNITTVERNLFPAIDCKLPDGQAVERQIVDPFVAASQASADEARTNALPVQPDLDGDPLTLSQEELIAQGRPPRPDSEKAPELYAQWLRIISAPKRRVSSNGVVRPGISSTVYASDTWSGPVITAPASGGLYDWIQAEWNVPNIPSPQRGTTFSASSSFWVGLDGAATVASVELMQAGTWQQVTDYYGASYYQQTLHYLYSAWNYYAWIQWFPDDSVGVSLTIHPSDTIYTEVWVGDAAGNYNTSGGYGWAYIYDVTTGLFYEGKVTKPGSKTFYGDSAEWIVERPIICTWWFGTTCANQPMANYGIVPMTVAVAYATDGNYYDWSSAPKLDYWMYTNPNAANATLLSLNYDYTSQILFEWVNYQ